jgi:hypothetical protein
MKVGTLLAHIFSISNLTKEKTMNQVLTSQFSDDVIGPNNKMIMNEDQVLEMYLEHLKSLMIQMIDNGLLHVEKYFFE